MLPRNLSRLAFRKMKRSRRSLFTRRKFWALIDRLGSIEPGKEATLFVCDGNILDIRANVKRMWIAGKEVSLESRHTRLYEKYKNRPLPK